MKTNVNVRVKLDLNLEELTVIYKTLSQLILSDSEFITAKNLACQLVRELHCGEDN